MAASTHPEVAGWKLAVGDLMVLVGTATDGTEGIIAGRVMPLGLVVVNFWPLNEGPDEDSARDSE